MQRSVARPFPLKLVGLAPLLRLLTVLKDDEVRSFWSYFSTSNGPCKAVLLPRSGYRVPPIINLVRNVPSLASFRAIIWLDLYKRGLEKSCLLMV
jgi:hypothetical protein